MEPVKSLTPIYSWNVNHFEVKLFQNHNLLNYEMVNTINGETVYKNPIDLHHKTAEQAILLLKNSQILIGEKGDIDFRPNFHRWNVDNYDLNLIKGDDDLIWDIFCKSTKESSYFSFSESTIPSARCHPETVALIEKIKNDSFKNKEIRDCLINSFKIVRVSDIDTYIKEYNELIHLEHFKEREELERYKHHYIGKLKETSVLKIMAPFLNTVILSASHFGINSLTSLAASSLGGGVLGIAAECTGLCLGVLTSIAPPTVIAAIGYSHWRYNADAENRKTLKRRTNLTMKSLPMLVEIEPKFTAVSKMDDRILISKFSWAVTLIAGPQGTSKGHTAIVVEGLANGYFEDELDDGQYFMHKSEFNPPIDQGLYPVEEYIKALEGGIKKTETWMVSSEKIVEMFKAIAKEKISNSEKHKQGKTVELSLYGVGCDSIISGSSHSCFTWAREKLKTLGIKVIKVNFGSPGFIATLPLAYTNTLEEHRKRPFTVQI